MRGFVACAKVTVLTLLTLYGVIYLFAAALLLAFHLELGSLALYALWGPAVLAATGGVVSGSYAAHFEPAHPYRTSIVAAILVVALIMSFGGGFMLHAAWLIVAAFALGVALAMFAVWAQQKLSGAVRVPAR